MSLQPPDPPLTDGVVTLRPPDEGDLAAIDEGINDPDVVRWFGPPTSSAAGVLAANRERWEHGSPTFSVDDADAACVGHVWVNVSATDPSIGYVGYWLLPRARGRGLATTAVRLLGSWAIPHLGISHLRLLTEPGNQASQRVAERSGFRRVEVLVGHDEIDGRLIDHVLFELPPRGG